LRATCGKALSKACSWTRWRARRRFRPRMSAAQRCWPARWLPLRAWR
jgi:hypothetical protein